MTVISEVVELLDDNDMFLKYPWGSESFLLTVVSVNLGLLRSLLLTQLPFKDLHMQSCF